MTAPISELPVLTPAPVAALDEHQKAQDVLAAAMRAAGAPVRSLFVHHQRRVLLESLAQVQTVDSDSLFSPARRFLGRAAERRLAGTEVAFRHADTRLTLRAAGHVAAVVGDDTPAVLHALFESHDPDSRETNPGLIRATPTWFKDPDTTFIPPEGGRCARLLSEAVAFANQAPAPAIVRAAWLTATVLAIHPFVDGNGRTARMLFHLVHSADLELGVDWGSLETWALRRVGYLEALKQGVRPANESMNVADVDTNQFVAFSVSASTFGALRSEARVKAIEQVWAGDWPSTSIDARLLEVGVALSATATISELCNIVADPTCSVLVNGLVAAGRLEWGSQGLLTLSGDHPLRNLAATMVR